MFNQLQLSDVLQMNNPKANGKNKNGTFEQSPNSDPEIVSRTANVDFGAQPELARDLVVAEYNSLANKLGLLDINNREASDSGSVAPQVQIAVDSVPSVMFVGTES